MAPLEATRAAMAEITAPIVTITLVLAAVFVPVAFIPGLTGRLYNQFAMTIVFSFLFSAFNSLTFSPAMARLFLEAQARRDEVLPRSAGSTRGLKWVEDSYDSFLDFTAHHWWTIVVPSLGLLALTGWMIVERPKAFIPTEDQGYLIVVVQTPDGTSREPTAGSSSGSSQIARELQGVARRGHARRLNVINAINQTNTGVVFVTLEDWHERTTPELRAAGLAAELQRELSDADPRRAWSLVLQPPPIRGLSQTGGFELMIEDREGKGVEALPAVVDRFLDEARKRPELAGVFTTFSARVPQLRFDLDRTKARRLDVPVSDVFADAPDQPRRLLRQRLQPLRQGLEGHGPGRGARPRTRPEDIQNLYVLNRKGERVPLSSLGEVKYALGPIDVPHYNLYAAAKINGQPAPGYSSGQAIAAMQEVAAEVLPEGFGYEWTGTTFQEQKTGNHGDLHLRPVDRLRLPVHGGPVRELDPADWSSS